MPVYIALLRGINVGGNKLIKMADLRALVEGLGMTQVKTLLQSGNVVFSSPETDPAVLTQQLEDAIRGRFGFESRIILRTADEWDDLVTHHPYTPEQLAEPSKLLVTLLVSPADEAAFAALLAKHTGREIAHLRGREIYAYFPEGMGRSKFDQTLNKVNITGTGRNWNTVRNLHTLAQDMQRG
jgi:uncharacterized protein (DUF1697 family)